MAQDSKATTGIPINPAGMNDNAPIESQPNWYQTRGLHSISEKCLRRMNGKSLRHKFSSPILAIHGGLRGITFIETSTKLYMFENLEDAIPV